MLLNINISNYAIIDKVNIHFEEGFNVLTGETGAGKSIIIGALNLILGGRCNKDTIRTGYNKATIQALFSIDKFEDIIEELSEYGIEIESDNTILITREVYSSGRSVSRINGITVTISMLKHIASQLVDIHSQNEHQSLTKKEKYVSFIDILGDKEHKSLLDNVKAEFNKFTKLKKQYKEQYIDDIEKQRKMELLKYQINEIDNSEIKEYEDEELNSEYSKLTNMESILRNVNSTLLELDADSNNSILNRLNYILSMITDALSHDDQLTSPKDTIQSVIYDVQDAQMELRKYINEVEFDAQRFEEIRSRLDTINTLKRKYGKTIQEIKEYRDSLKIELDDILNLDRELKNIKNNIQVSKSRLEELCNKLTHNRENISGKLVENINRELKEINMSKADFKIQISKAEKYHVNGNDDIEFLISTNLGESHKPLYRIASGGEMSRISLSFKSILARLDDLDCLVFDEIDTGISGQTAHMVGKKIKKISDVRQVICITHLPQIASLADVHFRIEKKEKDNKTYTDVLKLNDTQRIDEISRLIGGENLTQITKQTASELLNQTIS
ncbi:DNA repair protein RecN [Clostridiaceae bacterium M8S5]|nr:DNA repair protein RecN [Clostridiaceae bacterium M8S5]